MKLIYCPKCKDVFRLFFKHRSCKCGESGGYYEPDGLTAVINGKGIPIGFTNEGFALAIKNRPDEDIFGGFLFDAFVIPKKCETVKYI